MFSIFKKKHRAAVDFSGLGTDMHSHLLPGIDDGSKDLADSIGLIKGLEDLGYQKFITTPHIFWDLYQNDENSIGGAHESLKGELQRVGMTTPIHAAAEYYMDEHFDSLLDKKAPLLTLKDKLILVEFSFVNAPVNFKDQLFRLQIAGYQPVLAHPERYLYFAGNKKVFESLKDAGVLFQLNLLSLGGHYGKTTLDLAQYLVKKEYVNLLGTDLHHMRHLDMLRNSSHIMPVVNELLQSGRLLNPTL
jgi:protein-tyrosine phosphatase